MEQQPPGLAESLPWGIPVNLCSDPRHGASKAGAEYKLGGGEVSKWPEGLGIAATFDPEVCRAFGEAISQGVPGPWALTTALSPPGGLGHRAPMDAL